MELSGLIVPRSAFSTPLTSRLYSIYQRYYTPTDPSVFERDLARKTFCITLSDRAGLLCGFSTVERIDLDLPTGEAVVLFSGDTVIDRPHWGEQTLPFTWIEQAGRIKAERPDVPLYWLLVTKGHRTFRYLPAFARQYWPRPENDPHLRLVANAIALRIFGARYDPARGVLLADTACPTALRPEFQALDSARMSNRHVQYFLAQNPHHDAGEELVCLCELSVENLRPWALRQFRKGLE